MPGVETVTEVAAARENEAKLPIEASDLLLERAYHW